MKEEKKILKDPTRFVTKLFVLIWITLVIHLILKLTFNYWQPYVIPTPQLEELGNYINNHTWLRLLLDGSFYTLNSVVAMLCGTQQWKFKNKKQTIIVIAVIVTLFILNESLYLDDYTIIIGCFILPLLVNYRKWIWILLTFIFSFVFLALSLWLEGFTNADNTNYIIKLFLQGDYYIMLALNYILFNLLRMKKEKN